MSADTGFVFTTLIDTYLDDFVFRCEPEASPEGMLSLAQESKERDISYQFNIINRHTLQRRVRIDLSDSALFHLSLDYQDGNLPSQYRIGLLHDTDNCLVRILITVRTNNIHNELIQCRSIANSFLSWIALHTMEPVDFISVEFLDPLTDTKWIGNLLGIADMMPIRRHKLPSPGNIRSEHRLVLGLFREACVTNSPFYSLLSLYKILEGIYQRQIFKETDQMLIERGATDRRIRGKITASMIQLVGTKDNDEIEDLEGLTFQKYMEHLANFRHRLAHPLLANDADSWDAIITDDFDQRIPAAFHARLAKQVVQEALVEEFRLIAILDGENPVGEVSTPI